MLTRDSISPTVELARYDNWLVTAALECPRMTDIIGNKIVYIMTLSARKRAAKDAKVTGTRQYRMTLIASRLKLDLREVKPV